MLLDVRAWSATLCNSPTQDNCLFYKCIFNFLYQQYVVFLDFLQFIFISKGIYW